MHTLVLLQTDLEEPMKFIGKITKNWKCKAQYANPLFWQVVAALKIAKSRGIITSKSQCYELAEDGEALGEILGSLASLPAAGRLIGKTLGKCACKKVF